MGFYLSEDIVEASDSAKVYFIRPLNRSYAWS